MTSESITDPSLNGWVLVNGKWEWSGDSASYFYDSAQVGNQIVTTVDSAYVQDRISVDSSTTITLIDDYVDSDYIQARTAPQIQSDLVVKTIGFTAEVGVRYYINTSGGSVTMTLPVAPEFGNQVAFVDQGGSFSTTPAIMGRNGSNIMGLASDMNLDVDYFSGTVEYIDATLGWKLI